VRGFVAAVAHIRRIFGRNMRNRPPFHAPCPEKTYLTFARSRVARKNNGRKNRLRKMMLLHHH